MTTRIFHLDPQHCFLSISLIIAQLPIFGSYLGPKHLEPFLGLKRCFLGGYDLEKLMDQLSPMESKTISTSSPRVTLSHLLFMIKRHSSLIIT